MVVKPYSPPCSWPEHLASSECSQGEILRQLWLLWKKRTWFSTTEFNFAFTPQVCVEHAARPTLLWCAHRNPTIPLGQIRAGTFPSPWMHGLPGREKKSPSPQNSSTSCLLPEFFFSILKKTVLMPYSASTLWSTVNSTLRLSALAHREAQILFCYHAISRLPSLNKALLLEIKNACFQTVSLWVL